MGNEKIEFTFETSPRHAKDLEDLINIALTDIDIDDAVKTAKEKGYEVATSELMSEFSSIILTYVQASISHYLKVTAFNPGADTEACIAGARETILFIFDELVKTKLKRRGDERA